MEKINFQPMPSPPLTVKRSSETKQHPTTHRPFADHLQTALQTPIDLTISKHAQMRLKERSIQIDANQWGQMKEKIDEAKKMGVTDSLVLLKDAAFIVSAKNNTVITAMNREEATKQIFTDINGTIVLD